MDLRQAYREIAQSRSNYQLEKFVLGQHFSPEQQYKQLLLEAMAQEKNLKQMRLRIEKIKAQAEELRESEKKSDHIEADIIELDIEDLEDSLISSQRELDFLQELFDKSHKYTMQEIESNQAQYWEEKLLRVAQLQTLGTQTGLNWAQLEALQQANILESAIQEIPTMNHLNDRQNILQIPLEENRK